jgi:undecaprenyl diphosphate synthase
VHLQGKNGLPSHVAIIMDGNGRWAQRRGLLRQSGHEQGAKAAEDIVRYASELGIKYITLYSFSSENWQRSQDEIDAIMKILERYLKNDVKELIENNIRIRAIGDLERLPLTLTKTIKDALIKTAHCDKFIVTLALSYGAWEELILACKKMLAAYREKKIDIDDVDQEFIRSQLFTDGLPDPDLYIRTGGEVRLSNFLLMQISYSELYFCKTLWPDFQRSDFDEAIQSYCARKRRFGNVLLDSPE